MRRRRERRDGVVPRRQKEAKDKAKREQQERQRAEDLKRKAKREREAARNRERDRRLALWDPARKACAKALQKDAETLTRALPWADLAAHYGVQEAADAQLLRDETPSLGAPNKLNDKAQHDGTYLSSGRRCWIVRLFTTFTSGGPCQRLVRVPSQLQLAQETTGGVGKSSQRERRVLVPCGASAI